MTAKASGSTFSAICARGVRVGLYTCVVALTLSTGAQAGLGGADARIGEATSVTFVNPSLSKSYQLQAPLRHISPPDLPVSVIEQRPVVAPAKVPPSITLAGAHAPLQRDQIFWRHSGERADLFPRFRAQQQRRHDALTGPAQFIVMIFAFLIMSGLTAAFWLQIVRQSRDMRAQTARTRRLT
ncbi:MAG: hypothetical protein AAGJ70_08030 [Pseudomonadota bacterium]